MDQMNSNKAGKHSGGVSDLRMPLIGLQVTATTLVCLLLILYDIRHSFRRKLPWIPCRLFTLNSFTLFFLATSTKLSWEFTQSTKPHPHEELAKLCGPVLLCISIGVLWPSIGSMNDYERLVNLASQAITVFSVTLGTIIQICTGSISLMFVVEQALVIDIIWILLYLSWLCTVDLNGSMKHKAEQFKKQLEKDKSDATINITESLERFYNNSDYYCNPQLQTFNRAHYEIVGVLCAVCSALLFEAAIRAVVSTHERPRPSKVLEWPMFMVVGTQILTIAVGGFVIGFRWLTFVSHSKPFEREMLDLRGYLSFASSWINCIIYSLPWDFSVPFCKQTLQVAVITVAIVMFILETLSYWVDQVVVYPIWKVKQCRYGSMSEENNILDKWLHKKVTKNHQTWINRHDQKIPSQNLRTLLLLPKYRNISKQLDIINKENIDFCFLLAILASLLNVMKYDDSILKAFEEVFEIVYFIVEKGSKWKSLIDELNTLTDKSKMFAKDIWMSRGMKLHWFNIFYIQPLEKWLKGEATARDDDAQWKLLKRGQLIDDDVLDALKPQPPIPLDEHFVRILRFVLNQLPQAIFNYIVESPHQELEERIELSLKLLSKLNLPKDKIPWEGGHDIVDLIANQSSNTDTAGMDVV